MISNPDIRSVNSAAPERRLIEYAAGLIESGKMIVAPTETRYGLLTRADTVESIDALCRAKMRGQRHAIAVFARSRKEMEDWLVMTKAGSRLCDAFLPGALTLVAEACRDWPGPVVVDGTMGVRWSSSPVVGELLEASGLPLTATSANLSGQPESAGVEDVARELRDAVALYLDAGPLTGKTSTVVSCTGQGVKILREGAISAADIRAALGQTWK